MSSEGLDTVLIDYEMEDLPQSVKELRPAMFREGGSFCCILGPDPETGIFGRGDNPKAAFDDWDRRFKERMALNPKNDEVVEFVLDNMDAVNWQVW